MRKPVAFALAVATACISSSIHAQSAVTLYGVVDNGIEYQNGGLGSVARASSSGLYATVYGMKGQEDLGGGLYANFQLEQGFSGDTGQATNAAATFNRLAWVGLSGRYGETRFGRQKKPEYLMLNREMDASGVLSIASPVNSFNSATVRASNALAYLSPTIYGLTAHAMASLREDTAGPSGTFDFYNVALRYVRGSLRLSGGYEAQDLPGKISTQKIMRAAASYGFGPARLFVAYQSQRQTDNSEKLDIYSVSGWYEFNRLDRLALLYGYAHDRTGQGNNAQHVGLLFTHTMSKAVTLYAAAGFIQNRNQAQFALDGTQYSGVQGAPGANAKGMITGMTYRF